MAQWIESVVRARFLVAGLGESAAPPWWRTDALSPVGQRLLARLFPRTAIGAGLEMASRAASIEHDNKIGRIGAYHLFRLPIAEEAAVHDLLRSPQADAVLQRLADLSTWEQRLDALSALAGAESVVDAQGPLHCGSPAGLRRNKLLHHLCAAYVDALRHGTPVYPYLLEEVP